MPADAGAQDAGDAATPATCGDGVVEGDEACEPGPSACCKADCTGPLAQGTECRAQAGACDVAEVCDGSSAECPADAVADTGTTCRAADGACDVEDECDGASKDCADGVQPDTHVCRPADGDCDLADSCNGASKECVDKVQPDSHVCRPADGDCDLADSCDGASKECADKLQPDTHECRPANGDCDVADNCSGTSKACADVVEGASKVCRPADGFCDLAENCNATDKACPTNQFKAGGTACNDGNPCTDDDACSAGTCASITAHECGDGNDCTTDSCDSADTSGNPCRHVNLNATPCDDSNACTTVDSCTNGVCGGTGTMGCNDNNACTDDDCDPLEGCVVEYNSASCDDGNPCTVGDTCQAGSCQVSTARNCADPNVCTTDSCNSADTDGNPCVHTNNTLVCDDNDSCTTSSACANGSCAGSGNACGTGSTSCTPGTPTNTCACGPGYEPNGQGQCVPDTNECDPTPCGANTRCTDPSSAVNNFVCTCLPGYGGNPLTGCTDIDECLGDPCGEYGTCQQNAPGQGFSCTCDEGFATVAGQCVCDLSGTFVIRVDTQLSWSNIEGVENASNVLLSSWAIRRHEYDTQTGLLSMETVPCGGPTPDICGTGNPFVAGLGPEAYAQFFPNSIWTDSALLPTQLTEMAGFLEPLPDAAFVTDPQAVLFGISLTNPLAGWPANRNAVGTNSNGNTNGARWQDHDGDGQLAVTSYAVPPGGVAASATPAPPKAYGATSPDCPRGNPSAPRNSYQYWPYVEIVSVLPFNVDLYRVKRFRAASRLISHLRGTIKSCDFISGNVRGRSENEMPTPEGRVQGCVRCAGFDGSVNCSAANEVACNTAQVDFFDLQPQTQRATAASFMIERAPDDVTCAQARAFTFHPPAP